MLARVPGADIRINGTDDLSQSYLLVSTGHAGNLSYTARLTTVRVVCQNTLSIALSHAGSVFKVKHTKSADSRLKDAKTAMASIVEDSKTLGEKLNTLATRKMTKESMLSVINRLFPENKQTENQGRRNTIVTKVLELFEANDGNAIPEIRGSAYNMLNAVTEYADHFRTARITDSRQGVSLETARAENAIFGTADRLKGEALVTVLEETQGNPVHAYRSVSLGDVLTETEKKLSDDGDFLRSLGIRS